MRVHGTVATLCALAFSACAGPVEPPTSSCASDAACGGGQRCIQGWCVAAGLEFSGAFRREGAGGSEAFARCASPGGIAELTPLLSTAPLAVTALADIRVDGVSVGVTATGRALRVPCSTLAGGGHEAVAVVETGGTGITSAPLAFAVDDTPPSVTLVSPDTSKPLNRTVPNELVFAFSEPVRLPASGRGVSGGYPRLAADRVTLLVTVPVPPQNSVGLDVVLSWDAADPIRDDAGLPLGRAVFPVTFPPYVPPPTFDVDLSVDGGVTRIGDGDVTIRAIPSGAPPERIVLRLTHGSTRQEVLAAPDYAYVFHGAAEAGGAWDLVAVSELSGYTRTSYSRTLVVDHTPPTVARANADGQPASCRLTGEVYLWFDEVLDDLEASDFAVTDSAGSVPFGFAADPWIGQVRISWTLPAAPNAVHVAVVGPFADEVGNVRSSGELFACDVPVWIPVDVHAPSRAGARIRAADVYGPLWEETLTGGDPRIGRGATMLDPTGSPRRGPSGDPYSLAYFRREAGGTWSVGVETPWEAAPAPPFNANVTALGVAGNNSFSDPTLAWAETRGDGSVVRAFRLTQGGPRTWVELPGPTSSPRASAPRVAQIFYEWRLAWFAWLERETATAPPQAYARRFTRGIADVLGGSAWTATQALGSAPGVAASAPVLCASGGGVWVAFAEGDPGARTIRVLAWKGEQFEALPPISPELGTDVAEPSLFEWPVLQVAFVETGPGGRWIASARWNAVASAWERSTPACGPACTATDPLLTGNARYTWTRDDGALETVELNR